MKCKVCKGALLEIKFKASNNIPKDVREALGSEAGDRLYIGRESGKLVLRPLLKVGNPTEKLYGSVKSEKDAVEAIREFRKAEGRA